MSQHMDNITKLGQQKKYLKFSPWNHASSLLLLLSSVS
jgi:hypothetical protein